MMDKNVYEFIYAQTGEKIIEWKQCECGQEFPITDKDMEFYKKVSPIIGGQRYTIPAPTKCPDCRQQRRLARRNERKLYKRTCDAVGKQIISIYSDDKPYKVYDQKEWRSDKWDPMDYGREFDFSKTFFEQFNDMLIDVPRISMYNMNSENSEYANYISGCKNCYLSTICYTDNESLYYCYHVYRSKNNLDCQKVVEIENCYECIECNILFNSKFCYRVENSSDCFFSISLNNCRYCLFCDNLNNKQYHIYNNPVSKAEFEAKIEELGINKYSGLQKALDYYNNLLNERLVPFLALINCDNTFGDYNISCKDSINVHLGLNMVNTKNSWVSSDISYGQDVMGGIFEWGYETNHTGIGGSYYLFTSTSINSSYMTYTESCYNSSNLFGCIGLRNKKYCILNKQYTKEEYEQIVPKIIEHMKLTGERGEFFPASISPFGYNETVANEYYPLDKQTASSKGFKRQDKEYPINVPNGIELVNAKDLPDSIDDAEDDILQKAVVCEISGKPFRIVKPELEFYRKHKLPLPRKHPDVRHLERMKKRADRMLYLRKCDNCLKDIISVYPQESEYNVYCEECYNKEVY